MDINFYKILEIDNNASLTEIKKAYQKLSKKYASNKSAKSKNKLKEIDEAYKALCKIHQQKEKNTKKTQNTNTNQISTKNVVTEETNKENIVTWFGIIVLAFIMLAFVVFVK